MEVTHFGVNGVYALSRVGMGTKYALEAVPAPFPVELVSLACNRTSGNPHRHRTAITETVEVSFYVSSLLIKYNSMSLHSLSLGAILGKSLFVRNCIAA